MLRLFAMTAFPALLISAAPMYAGTSATTFTFQGRLREAGLPANGHYHIDYWLWDAPTGGSQVGSTIHFVTHDVTNGIFSSELDFGAGAFNGQPRWLEISVDGEFLSPRQPITASPYSIAPATNAPASVEPGADVDKNAVEERLLKAIANLQAENEALRERLERLEAVVAAGSPGSN